MPGTRVLFYFHLTFCYCFAQFLTGPFCLIWLNFQLYCVNLLSYGRAFDHVVPRNKNADNNDLLIAFHVYFQ